MRRWWKRLSPSWIILTLALLPATYYLWLPGLQTTMDGLYHKSRFFELDWLLRMGTLYPRWLPHQGFLYGFPTLHFYAPLIYYIAEGFHLLGWGFLASYEWMIGLGMVAAGWTMFYFARRWGPRVGWLAAIAYTYWVYHFSLAYVRGAQAELWAMVWYPLILAFVHHVVRRPSPFPGNRHLALALSYALLMLTHNLSVLLFTPVAIAYALWLLLWGARAPNRRERLTPLAHTVMSLAWGAGLAAFYWIPVLADIKYVRAGHTHQEGLTGLLQSLVPLQNLLLPYWFHPRQPLQGVQGIEPRGQVALCVWMGGALLVPFLWKRWTRERRSQVSFFLLLTLGAILGMSTWSRWFWKTLPFFYYVQFPWRLESLVGLGLALSVGLIWGDVVGRASRVVRGRWGQYALLGGLTLALGVSGLGGIPYDIAKNPATWQPLREEDVDLALVVQYDYLVGLAEREFGGVWPFEYLPIWAAGAANDFFLPPENPLPDRPPLDLRAVPGRQHPYDRHFQVTSPTRWTFTYHQFYFPAWQVEVDGHRVSTYPRGDLGLVAADIPPGEHHIRLHYGATRAQRAARVLALLVGLLWLGMAVRQDRRWLLLPALGLLYLTLTRVPAQPNPRISLDHRPRSVLLGDRVRLIGSRILTPEVRPGQKIWFTLDWFALAPPQRRYKVIVHLTDLQGNTLANGDTEPGFFFTPTTRWHAGEIMEDWYNIRVPETLAPGTYLLLTGMYDAETVQNLPIRGEPPVAGRILVGQVRVLPAR